MLLVPLASYPGGERQRVRDKSWLDPQKMCESIDPYGETISIPFFGIVYVTYLSCLCWRHSTCTQRASHRGVCTVVVDFRLDILDHNLSLDTDSLSLYLSTSKFLVCRANPILSGHPSPLRDTPAQHFPNTDQFYSFDTSNHQPFSYQSRSHAFAARFRQSPHQRLSRYYRRQSLDRPGDRCLVHLWPWDKNSLKHLRSPFDIFSYVLDGISSFAL
jgi:hypothetical protein